MVNLLHIPTEILRLILSALFDIDVFSFFTARRTCKTFQNLITDILEISINDHGVTVDRFLEKHFLALLNSTAKRIEPIFYRSSTDCFAPLRTMPWAVNSSTREKYLRPNASWLRLPLFSESGNLVRRLQIIVLQGETNPIDPFGLIGGDVHFPPPHDNLDTRKPAGGVTIGMLYNAVISQEARPDLTTWGLMFDEQVNLEAFSPWRMKSCSEWEDIDFELDDLDVEDVFEETEEGECAVLYVEHWNDEIVASQGPLGEEELWKVGYIGENATCVVEFDEHDVTKAFSLTTLDSTT